MATSQNRLKPPFLPFLTALIFTGVLVAVSLSVSTNILENFLLCGIALVLIGSWRWVASGQDAIRRAALFLSLSVALVIGRIWWDILPGNWFVLIPLAGGFGFLTYLFLRLFLSSAVEVLWALSLPTPPRFSQLETWRMLLYTDVPLTANLIWRVLIEKLKQDGSAEAAKLLANVVTSHPNQSAHRLALRALDQLIDRKAIDALCTVWAETRHPDLAGLLTSKQWRASTPPPTLTLSALLLGQVDFLRGSKVERIQPLAQAALDTDPLIAERAGQVLRSLKNVEAQEALCRLVIEQENPSAQAAALSSGYLPRDEQPRVLFLFMTGQWERYASHDFDRRLMHLAYLTAPEPLRQRIREKLRSVGRIDFLPIIAGESSGERAAAFNAGESEVLVQTLIANRDWPALWPRVFDLPFQSSVRAILALSASDWKPTNAEEQAIFAELAALAAEGLPMEPSEVWEDFPLASMQATARVPGRINAVAFAPSHPAIAVGTGQGTVVLWNYQTGRRERVLRNFQHSIGKVAFSPAGTLLCAERTNGTATCSIYVFTDPCNSDASYPLGTHDGSVTALVPVSDSQVLSSGADGSVVSWDALTRREINRIRVNDWARNMRVSPDGGQLLLIRRGLDLLTVPDLHSVATVGKSGVFRCAAFSPDAKTMFAGTFSGQLLAYKRNEKRSDHLALEKKPLTTYPDPERVEAVEVLDRLSLLVSVGTGGEIRFFSLDAYTLLGSVTVPGGQITSLNISPDESFLAVGSTGSTLTLWDLRTLDMRLLLEHPFAQAAVTILPTLTAMVGHSNITARARRALQFAQIILHHRFRFAIEIGEAPSIALGEFDIEID